ncbi:MAG TPA: ABC transporter permease [Saprospiraceae bacterium]|nr:ABC transporter permease [Saprospiraceae bacterium]
MINHFVKIAWRNLLKKPVFSFINIVGLALGIGSTTLIYMYINDELKYNTFHDSYDHLFQVGTSILREDSENHYSLISRVAGEYIRDQYPEIAKQTLIQKWKPTLFIDEQYYNNDQLVYTEPDFIDMFTFPAIEGDPKKGLEIPNSLVITQKMKEKYFSGRKAVGESIIINDTMSFTISAVISDPPVQSLLQFDALVSYETLRRIAPAIQDWTYLNQFMYILLHDPKDAVSLEEKLKPLPMEEFAEPLKGTGMTVTLGLDALKDLYLKSTRSHSFSPSSDIKYIYTFSYIALFILLLAIINYVNLSTARSVERAREVGVRKVNGTKRRHLIFQFLTESVVLSLIAFIISIIVLIISIPGFNILSGKNFTSIASEGPLFEGNTIFAAFAIALCAGIFAGLYPAFVMSGIQPLDMMKGGIYGASGGLWFRRSLVFFQFTISVGLILCSLVAYRQLHFMLNKDLGFNKDQVVVIDATGVAKDKLNGRFVAFKNDALLSPLLQNVALASSLPGKGTPYFTVYPEGINEGETRALWVVAADYDFPSVFGLEMIAGRSFSQDYPNDPAEGLLINESAIHEIGWEGGPEEALGKRIKMGSKDGVVVGVFRDFHYFSLKSKLGPLMIHMNPLWYGYISVQVSGGEFPKVVQDLEKVWKEHFPEYSYSYFFLDEDFATQYKSDFQLFRIISLFTIIGILIATIGMIGLTTYSTFQRMKEIGLRKILGASSFHLIRLLGKEMTFLVLMAIAMGSALGYIYMTRWLKDFPYKVNIELWDLLASGATSLLITWIFTGLIIYKASKTPPSLILKHE